MGKRRTTLPAVDRQKPVRIKQLPAVDHKQKPVRIKQRACPLSCLYVGQPVLHHDRRKGVIKEIRNGGLLLIIKCGRAVIGCKRSTPSTPYYKTVVKADGRWQYLYPTRCDDCWLPDDDDL
jgi:hypothetical protein